LQRSTRSVPAAPTPSSGPSPTSPDGHPRSSRSTSCEVLRAPISRGAERPGRVRQGLRSWFMKHVMRLLLVTTLSLAGLTGLAPWRSSDG
jgi:hypothetical protein